MSSRVMALSIDAAYVPPPPKEDGSPGEELPFKVAFITEGSIVIGSVITPDEGAPGFELGEIPDPEPELPPGTQPPPPPPVDPMNPPPPPPEPVMFEVSPGVKLLGEPVAIKKNLEVKMKWVAAPSKPNVGVKGYLLVIPLYG